MVQKTAHLIVAVENSVTEESFAVRLSEFCSERVTYQRYSHTLLLPAPSPEMIETSSMNKFDVLFIHCNNLKNRSQERSEYEAQSYLPGQPIGYAC